MNENETIADIRKEAEGRFRKLCIEHVNGLGHLQAMQEFNHVFDRIEAVQKREQSQSWHHREMEELVLRHEKELADARMSSGNTAAMREACVNIVEYARSARCHTDDAHVLGFLDQIERWAQAALAAPPRNCDMYGGDCKMLHTAWFDWTGSPSGQNPDGTAKMGFGEWLLALAGKRGAV